MSGAAIAMMIVAILIDRGVGPGVCPRKPEHGTPKNREDDAVEQAATE